jgi:hypothetical protein
MVYRKELTMKLMTKELEKIIPKLYATEDIKLEEKVVYAKFFTPDANWTWWVLEYDKDEKICFAMVHGHERELGYVSITELESVRGPLGLNVERDMSFKPTKYKDIGDLR